MTTSQDAPLQAWTEPVETLLVGTARRALAPVAPSDPWADALPATADPAEALADRCALLGVYEQAGRALSRGPAEPPAAFRGEERPASERATVWLRQILRPGGGEFLFEWLTCAAQRGLHRPPELLPRLLTAVRGRSDLGLAQLAAEVAGPRGQWLAKGRERWRGLWQATDLESEEQLVAQFETASTRERETAFRALRERDPGTARERLRADFAKEPADLRAAFLIQWIWQKPDGTTRTYSAVLLHKEWAQANYDFAIWSQQGVDDLVDAMKTPLDALSMVPEVVGFVAGGALAGVELAQHAVHGTQSLATAGKNVGGALLGVLKFKLTAKLARKYSKAADIPQDATIGVDPKTILFSQDRIGRNFRDGRSVSGLADDLKAQRVSADDVSPILVFARDGTTFTFDNKWSYAIQEPGAPIRTASAATEKIDAGGFKFTTTNGCTHVRYRGGGV